jgi:hypothetical protein
MCNGYLIVRSEPSDFHLTSMRLEDELINSQYRFPAPWFSEKV